MPIIDPVTGRPKEEDDPLAVILKSIAAQSQGNGIPPSAQPRPQLDMANPSPNYQGPKVNTQPNVVPQELPVPNLDLNPRPQLQIPQAPAAGFDTTNPDDRPQFDMTPAAAGPGIDTGRFVAENKYDWGGDPIKSAEYDAAANGNALRKGLTPEQIKHPGAGSRAKQAIMTGFASMNGGRDIGEMIGRFGGGAVIGAANPEEGRRMEFNAVERPRMEMDRKNQLEQENQRRLGNIQEAQAGHINAQTEDIPKARASTDLQVGIAKEREKREAALAPAANRKANADAYKAEAAARLEASRIQAGIDADQAATALHKAQAAKAGELSPDDANKIGTREATANLDIGAFKTKYYHDNKDAVHQALGVTPRMKALAASPEPEYDPILKKPKPGTVSDESKAARKAVDEAEKRLQEMTDEYGKAFAAKVAAQAADDIARKKAAGNKSKTPASQGKPSSLNIRTTDMEKRYGFGK